MVELTGVAVLALSGFTPYFRLVFVLGAALIMAMGGMVVAPIRREEEATDMTAAALFGEVLSEAGVTRLRRSEHAGGRLFPAVIRSHPHPASRRRAGLAVRSSS